MSNKKILNKKNINIAQILPEKSLEYLQIPLVNNNGFREYDVRWLYEKELNNQGLIILGKAFGTQLQKEFDVYDIIVGFDYRKYSQNVKNAFVIGLLSTGMNVIDIGLALTPMVYFAQYFLNVKGCAMITASHNENGWTGIKLGYDLSKTFGPEEISRLKKIVHSGVFLEGRGNYIIKEGFIEKYIDDIVKNTNIQKKLKIVVATGNGTAGIFAPKTLKKLGFNIIEVNTELDWDFPNCNPNPEDISFLESIGKTVKDVNADFGIGIDGDGDRLGVVDENGEEIFSDKVGLIISRDIIKEYPGSTIIIDVKTTGLFLVDEILKENKAKIVFWKTGHSYIKSKVQELNALAGFEKSGHMFFNKPIGRGYDDALFAAIQFSQVISKYNKTVSELISSLPKSHQTPTMAPYCDDVKKYKVIEAIQNLYLDDWGKNKSIANSKIKNIIDVNGVRFVLEDNSWGLIRASSNKPSLVVVAESFGTKKQLYDIFDDIKFRLSKFPEVGEFDQIMPPYKGED